jgi:FeS assembly SUF system regulator
VFRLSKLSDYAVVVLSELGRAPGGAVRTASGLAAATGIAEPTVAKVLKLLASSGLVTSQRGAHGGYRLARPLAAIPIADVIAAIEGPIALTACVDGHVGSCEVECSCPVRGRWDPVNAAIRHALSEITLADMACPAWALPAPVRVAEPAV